MNHFFTAVVICMTFMQSGCSHKELPAQAPTAVSVEANSLECQAITHDIDRLEKRLNELELSRNSKQCH